MSDRSVALFIRTLHGGGAERVFLRLAGGLEQAGYDVTVVAVDARGHDPDWVPSGVEVVDLRARSLAAAALPLARYLRRHRPGVLLSAVSAANVIALTARLVSRLDVPVVVTEHNTQSQQRADATTLRRRRVTPWLMRRLYPRAQAVVGVSQGVADDLTSFLGLPPGAVVSVPNPVVDPTLTALAGEPLPHPWGQRVGEAPLVVSAGRLVAHKDHATLLASFALVLERIPDARLAILGEGEARQDIERLRDELGVQDSVLLVGFQANPYAWLSRATVLALSSRYEGLPTILIEALACGARVVATDCPSGPAEILDGGQWGSLVPVGDVDAFADALTDSLRLGRWPEPPQAALEPYRPERVIAGYRRIIDPLLERAGSRS